MTEDEKRDVKLAVKEAVNEQLPETLAEVLTPMIRRTVHNVLRPFRRAMIAAYLLLVISVSLLYFANKERVNDIQNQRISLCEDQNNKHDNTIKEINKQVAIRKKSLSAKARVALDERRNQTVLLINVLAPKRDCQKVINQNGK